MAFDFPANPAINDVYTDGTISYTWDGEVWRGGGATSGQYVLKVGDTMTGPLVLPSADPSIDEHSTHKRYVDEQIATFALYQGTWQVAANIPDLNVPPNAPLHAYSWTAQTADPNIPEVAPATIPGIGGLIIVATDTVKWNANTLVYELVRGPVALAKMTIADLPPATPFHGQMWWESDSGKMYVYFTDVDSSQWVQVSGGGGGTVGGIADAPADGQMYGRQDLSWVPATGGTGGGIPDAPADGNTYGRKDLDWAIVSAAGGAIPDDAPNDGLQYGRQSLAWTPVPPTTPYRVPVSDTAPVAPDQGMLWFNSADASLYIWFDDGTSQQWVEISA
jgi:hypothetical protein